MAFASSCTLAGPAAAGASPRPKGVPTLGVLTRGAWYLERTPTRHSKADSWLQIPKLAVSEVGIGAFVETRQELGSEAGALRGRDVPVSDRRKCREEFLVPASVVGPDRLLHQSIRQVDGDMGRGCEHHRPCTVVGRDGPVAGLCHGRDLLGLADAAAPANVEHHDPGPSLLYQLPEGRAARERLAGGYGDVGGGGELG